MQKTVGMITIYRKNYGAFLQAYALQQALMRVGLEPEVIRYDYYKDRSFIGVPFALFKREPMRFLKSAVVEIVRHRNHKRRALIFQKSIDRYIHESEAYYKNYSALEKEPPDYDIYLTGSDQVFNVKLSPPALQARLLAFAKGRRRVSYAASAGNGEIPHDYDTVFSNELSSFEQISVREEALKKYVEENYGLSVERHIDPTLLLTREEWNQFADHTNKPQHPYIFFYQVLQQKELHEKAEEISGKLGLPIYSADGNDVFLNQIQRDGILSPEKWVGRIMDAEYVVTNSFHGTAFAVNLGKRASVIVPTAGGDRVLNLLEKCDLSKNLGQSLMPDKTEEIYRKANVYFARERKRSLAYFQQLL